MKFEGERSFIISLRMWSMPVVTCDTCVPRCRYFLQPTLCSPLLTWSQVEAHADLNEYRNVIRIVKSNKQREHYYLYHTIGEIGKTLHTESGSIK